MCFNLSLRFSYLSSSFNTAIKASCGISTEPTDFILFLPFFCFSNTYVSRDVPTVTFAVTSLRIALTVERAMILFPIAA